MHRRKRENWIESCLNWKRERKQKKRKISNVRLRASSVAVWRISYAGENDDTLCVSVCVCVLPRVCLNYDNKRIYFIFMASHSNNKEMALLISDEMNLCRLEMWFLYKFKCRCSASEDASFDDTIYATHRTTYDRIYFTFGSLSMERDCWHTHTHRSILAILHVCSLMRWKLPEFFDSNSSTQCTLYSHYKCLYICPVPIWILIRNKTTQYKSEFGDLKLYCAIFFSSKVELRRCRRYIQFIFI